MSSGAVGGLVLLWIAPGLVVVGAVLVGVFSIAKVGAHLSEAMHEEAHRRAQERKEQAHRQEMEARRRLEGQRQILIRSVERLAQDLSGQIGALGDTTTKRSLEATLQKGLDACRREIHRGGTDLDEFFRDVRRGILEAKMEEEMGASLGSQFEARAAKIESDLLPGFRKEWEALRASAKEARALPVGQMIPALRSALARADELAQHMAKVAEISLEGLAEDVFVVPDPTKRPGERGVSEEIASARAAIADFGGRVAFFDQEEAASLQSLLEESTSCGSLSRLSLIRNQVTATYGKLKERKVLTELFKQDLRELLPVMQRTKNAESVIVRMEDLLNAREVGREDFSPLYGEIKAVLAEQMEYLIDDAVTRKAEGVLHDMGYSLVAEEEQQHENLNGDLRPGEIRHLNSPYEGYRVRVRVDKGKVTTRLVRVVGSEEEARSGGEYQRQKDEEIGRKWCQDLDSFYGALKKDGIRLESVFRKEPGEEPLDVVVDEKMGPRRSGGSAQGASQQERQRA